MGKMHLFLNAFLKKVISWFAPDNARARFEREEITAVQAMRIIKRDALALLGQRRFGARRSSKQGGHVD